MTSVTFNRLAVLAGAALLAACAANPFQPSAALVMVGSASEGPAIAQLAASYGIGDIQTRFEGTDGGIAAFCGQDDSSNDGDQIIDVLVATRALTAQETDGCAQDGVSYETFRHGSDTVLIRKASFGSVIGLDKFASSLRN